MPGILLSCASPLGHCASPGQQGSFGEDEGWELGQPDALDPWVEQLGTARSPRDLHGLSIA